MTDQTTPLKYTNGTIPNDPRAAEADLFKLVASCYADPLRFVKAMYTWGEGELRGWDGPDKWQEEFLVNWGEQIKKRGFDGVHAVMPILDATVSGHGIGKSALVAWIIQFIMSTRPYATGTVTAGKLVQLETKTWAQLAKWHSLSVNKHWFRWYGTRNNLAFRCILEDEHGESLENRWFCTGQTCKEENSDSFQGQHAANATSFYIFDEASAVPDAIWEVADWGLTDGEPMWFVFGNPVKNTGRFYECFHGREEKNRWVSRQIDSRNAKIPNREMIDGMVAAKGEDSDYIRVRVRGVFPRAGSTQFIAGDSVREAVRREVIPDPMAPLILGVDVARFGDDETVLIFRRGNDARSIPMVTAHGWDTMQTADRVAHEILEKKVDAVFIEGVGVGGGVVDRLKQRGFKVHEVNPGGRANIQSTRGKQKQEFANKRAEFWSKGKEWLEKGCLPADVDLEEELTLPEYEFDASGRLKLEPKKEMKKRLGKSPDRADALLLTFSEKVMPREERDRIPQQAESDYDILKGIPSASPFENTMAEADYDIFG